MLSSVVLPAAISFAPVLINFTEPQSGRPPNESKKVGDVACHASNRAT